jgi:aminoglycoside phosphotransferase
MSSLLTGLSAQQLRRAAELKDKIQSLEKELGRIGVLESKAAPAKKSSKRKMSAATKAKIAAAARARWAKVRAGKK